MSKLGSVFIIALAEKNILLNTFKLKTVRKHDIISRTAELDNISL